MDNGLTFFEAKLLQHPSMRSAAEDAHQVVFERQVEACDRPGSP
jgi:hypothetical protein